VQIWLQWAFGHWVRSHKSLLFFSRLPKLCYLKVSRSPLTWLKQSNQVKEMFETGNVPRSNWCMKCSMECFACTEFFNLSLLKENEWYNEILFCVSLLGQNHPTLRSNAIAASLFFKCNKTVEGTSAREESSEVEQIFNEVNLNIQWQQHLPTWTARQNVCLKWEEFQINSKISVLKKNQWEECQPWCNQLWCCISSCLNVYMETVCCYL